MSFPRYPKYKPSGVERLGEVPAHWDVTRLKRACTASPSNIDKKSYDGEQSVLLCNYTDVYYNDFITADLDFMVATASQAQIEKFTLRAGDTIITKDSETADDIAVAAFVPNDLPGVVCGYHLSVIRPRSGTAGSFVKWWFASRFAKSCFAVRANGLTRVGLGQHELENVELALPPLPEQRAIAAFLDRETVKIDGLVAEQRRLIELLKEKRQAVISHAVTKGLDPAAPMKPSGVEWLGEVPAHWERNRLENFCEFVWGKAHEQFVCDDGVHVCATVRFVSTGGQVDRRCGQNLTPAIIGDVLMVMSDLPNGRALARALLVQDAVSYAINQRVCAVRVKEADPWYFAYQLNRHPQLLAEDDGCNQTHLSNHDFTKLKVLVPPLEEQRAIATFLDRETAKIDGLVAEAEAAITLLQERRSALISAAVTGQIDVRNEPVSGRP
jgi:type I restriction enzyme S subunit